MPAPSSTENVNLIRRGKEALQVLEARAQAAQAVAEQAELEHLLEMAESGNEVPLSAWLTQKNGTSSVDDAGIDQASQSDTLPTDTHAHAEPTAKFSASLDRADAFEGWETLRQSAVLRVQSHRDSLEKLRPSTGRGAKDSQHKDNRVDEPARLKADVVQHFSAFKPDLESLNEAQSAQSPQAKKWSGVIISLVLHGLLIGLLAVITLQLPTPPASLAFETYSETTSETIEVSETLEVAEPTDTDSLDTPETPQLDPSSSLESFDSQSLTADLSSELGENATSSAAGAVSSLMGDALGGSGGTSGLSPSFFGAQASGNCFCYIVDGSGSMRNGPWDAAKRELLRSLGSLKPHQRFYIIFYNRETYCIPSPGEQDPAPRTLYATRDNIIHARRWLETLRIDSGAPPNDALEKAIAVEPDAIYLLSDGDTKADVAGFLQRINRTSDILFGEQVKTPIHTIAFYSRKFEAKLRQIAIENKGQCIYVPNPNKP